MKVDVRRCNGPFRVTYASDDRIPFDQLLPSMNAITVSAIRLVRNHQLPKFTSDRRLSMYMYTW